LGELGERVTQQYQDLALQIFLADPPKDPQMDAIQCPHCMSSNANWCGVFAFPHVLFSACPPPCWPLAIPVCVGASVCVRVGVRIASFTFNITYGASPSPYSLPRSPPTAIRRNAGQPPAPTAAGRSCPASSLVDPLWSWR